MNFYWQAIKLKMNFKELDARTLFVKNIPDDVTEEELKALSADIQNVRIKENLKRNNKKKNKKFT